MAGVAALSIIGVVFVVVLLGALFVACIDSLGPQAFP